MDNQITFNPPKPTSPTHIWRGIGILLIILVLAGILKSAPIGIIFLLGGLLVAFFSVQKSAMQVTIDTDSKYLVYEYITALGKTGEINFDLTSVDVTYKNTQLYRSRFGWDLKISQKNSRTRLRLTETEFAKTQLDEMKKLIDSCQI